MLKLVLLLVLLTATPGLLQGYKPNWDSLDSRPLPTWFDEAKFGIFIHWGVFSVPSFGTEWFWYRWKGKPQDKFVKYMEKNYKPDFTYQDFAKDFTAELFDPKEWAKIFKNSGAKYVVLTTKHHEGYTMWPSKYSYSWNAKDVGPNRDLVAELGEAVRAANLTWGLYHSLYEWFNPLYLADKSNNWTTRDFPEHKSMAELYELVNTYKPSVIWSDGNGGAPDTYWKAPEFLAWLYNESPVKDTVVVNDRWGDGTGCKHGGFFSCNDRYNPGTLQKHKWENAMTIDKHSWGFRREAKLEDYLTTHELLTELVTTVSCGGNILMNVGPTKDGIIPIIFQKRLKDLGEWLSLNGEAIYGSKPWIAQNDSLTEGVWYTTNNGNVYALVLYWPPDVFLELGSIRHLFDQSGTVVTLLGFDKERPLRINENSVSIGIPPKSVIKSDWVYVLKIKPEKQNV